MNQSQFSQPQQQQYVKNPVNPVMNNLQYHGNYQQNPIYTSHMQQIPHLNNQYNGMNCQNDYNYSPNYQRQNLSAPQNPLNQIFVKQIKLIFSMISDQNRDIVQKLQKQNQKIISQYKAFKNIILSSNKSSKNEINDNNTFCDQNLLQGQIELNQQYGYLQKDLDPYKKASNYVKDKQKQSNSFHNQPTPKGLTSLQKKILLMKQQRNSFTEQVSNNEKQEYQDYTPFNNRQDKKQQLQLKKKTKMQKQIIKQDSQGDQQSFLVEGDGDNYQNSNYQLPQRVTINFNKYAQNNPNVMNRQLRLQRFKIQKFFEEYLSNYIQYAQKFQFRTSKIYKKDLTQIYVNWRNKNHAQQDQQCLNYVSIRRQITNEFKIRYPKCTTENECFVGVKLLNQGNVQNTHIDCKVEEQR